MNLREKIDKIYRHIGKAALGCQTTWILIQVQLVTSMTLGQSLSFRPQFPHAFGGDYPCAHLLELANARASTGLVVNKGYVFFC